VIIIKRIQEEQLETIKGGNSPLFTVWTGVAIAAIVVFISGVIDGITNPNRCGE
jgi:hypothetical protein